MLEVWYGIILSVKFFYVGFLVIFAYFYVNFIAINYSIKFDTWIIYVGKFNVFVGLMCGYVEF